MSFLTITEHLHWVFMRVAWFLNHTGLKSNRVCEGDLSPCVPTDDELSSHDETNTAEIIDQMFDEVLEYAGQMEREQTTANDITEDRDSGIGSCSGDKDKTDPESDKEKGGEEPDPKDETCNKSKTLEMSEDELLTFPPSGILSPLSKSVEAVVTPLVRVITQHLPLSLSRFVHKYAGIFMMLVCFM